MGPRALSPLASLRLRWLLACGLLGPVLEAGRPDLEQTVHLSSYEIITPWRLTRERREALGPSSQQISYVIQAQGKQHIIHLERNTDLLPNDFVVYTYDKEGSLLSDHPNVQRRRAVLPQTRYVELFIVVDKERYDMMGRNQTAVREEMIRLANYLDSMYIMLNIRIVLVGLEIWTDRNPINIIGGAGDVLGNFVQWREKFLITRRRHDSAQLVFGSRNFSSCSAEDFEKLTLNKGGSCLLNIPKPDEAYSAPSCGNKLVDPGEECDCGTAKECEVDPCCEGSTCKLKSFAECAYGDCCKDCQFLPGGSMCRGKTSECDVPEYCNGSSQFCPPDVFIQNGYPCQNSKAYCYNGMCQYYDAQCQVIFGSKAKAAPRDCFIEVNSKGDRFGNCGFSGSEYKKCATGNALCGKLQCENVQDMPVFGIVPAIIQTPSRGTKCWGVDFQLGSDVPDPGMVNEGTKCDAGKICRNFQCVNASVLNYDCDIQGKCHGHGVCNSNKNCHCEDGWAPPHCDTKGYGGSVDSGPTYNAWAWKQIPSTNLRRQAACAVPVKATSTTTENIFSGKLDSGSARSCTSFI